MLHDDHSKKNSIYLNLTQGLCDIFCRLPFNLTEKKRKFIYIFVDILCIECVTFQKNFETLLKILFFLSNINTFEVG